MFYLLLIPFSSCFIAVEPIKVRYGDFRIVISKLGLRAHFRVSGLPDILVKHKGRREKIINQTFNV